MTDAVTVTGVLKAFVGTLVLSTGGALIGLIGGLVMAGGSGSARFAIPQTVTTTYGMPVSFLLGTAASAYFFGWLSLLCAPAVLLVIAGRSLFLKRKRRRTQQRRQEESNQQ